MRTLINPFRLLKYLGFLIAIVSSYKSKAQLAYVGAGLDYGITWINVATFDQSRVNQSNFSISGNYRPLRFVSVFAQLSIPISRRSENGFEDSFYSIDGDLQYDMSYNYAFRMASRFYVNLDDDVEIFSGLGLTFTTFKEEFDFQGGLGFENVKESGEVTQNLISPTITIGASKIYESRIFFEVLLNGAIHRFNRTTFEEAIIVDGRDENLPTIPDGSKLEFTINFNVGYVF